MAAVVAVVAAAGWALLAAFGGGIDTGDGLPGAGPTGAFVALFLGAPLAAWAALAAWGTAALRSRTTLVAIAGAGGLAVWSALSIVWAGAPDLAWIDANRMAIGVCALAAGVGLAARVPGVAPWFGPAVALAAALPVVAALATKIAPALAGGDRDLARLSTPVGYWNALALIAVMAVPGLVWCAAGAGAPTRRWGAPLAGAGLTLVATAVLLTYSRGGLVAALVVVALLVALLPHPARVLAAVAGGAIGAVWPAAFALTHPALNTDLVPVAVREGPGLGLGWRLVVGMALGAAAAAGLALLAERLGGDARTVRRGVGLVCAVVAGLAVAGTLALPAGRDWVGDRWQEARGVDVHGGAVANDPGRIVSAAGNQRQEWWGEAWAGFTDAPLIGEGAGGFRLVHLRHRAGDDDRLLTVEPHDLVLRTLSGTGLVGFALLAALVGAVIAGIRAALRRVAAAEVAAPLAVLAAFAVQSVVDWSWAIPALTVPVFAAAGVLLAAGRPGRASSSLRPGGPAVAALGVAVVITMGSALMPWWSVRLTDRADAALAAGDPATALQRADAAAARNPLALGPLRMRAAALTALGDRARALGTVIRMTEVQPGNPASWRALARAYGSDARALPAWRRVLELSPHDRAARAALGG